MNNEVERLQLLTVAQDSKIRELEDALARCAVIGIRLREALSYIREHEPTVSEIATVVDEATRDED